ncbi:serine/threonine protein kinase [Mesobacillus campisalis]|uniref:Serine/threonine protein kinase n=1 Tax=Mesobacillus campisalis TaxID=1408103 RepID=A0A0M2SUT6_9BACI|nr:serine/threonine protein kinase [Mesobacillus campisalis]KKK37466.1 serine/threonine protein kinase [Mesobacillus campisalis]
MKSFSSLAKSVKFTQIGSETRLDEKDADLEFIGRGRSAYVFKIRGTNKVLKVFFAPFEKIAKEEANIYTILQGIHYYPNIYEHGPNYLVIDYIAGDTLFNCLVKGIAVTEAQISEIDYALDMARARNLNPSDIHLRNILITKEGRIKIIDVARFRQTKKCKQWDDLKSAFYRLYRRRLFPKKAPEWVLNLIAFLYKKRLISALP